MLRNISPTVLNANSTWQDFGWYTDEFGKKQYGVIPKY